MASLNNPNSYNGSDSEKIEQALAYAVEHKLPLEITGRDAGDGRTHWLIDRAILLPGNFTLNIVDCMIQLSDICRDNFIRSANCFVGVRTVEPIENITIRGIGNAVLRGADHPRATGDSAKQLGVRSYGTDAGRTDENPRGDWRNIGILFAEVSNFTIENIEMADYHCWGISLEFCSYGSLRKIRFDATGSKVIDGKDEVILNQDGIDLRIGCHHIDIEDISGRTGDDMVALTGIGVTDTANIRQPGTVSTHFSGSAKRDGDLEQIHHVTIRNIHGYCHGRHHLIRLLNSNGLKLHHIEIEDVMDESTEEFTAYATLKIGDKNPHWGSTNPPEDTAFITVRNLRSNSRVGVQIQNALSDSRFSGITRGEFCDDVLKIIDLNLLKNVEFDTFSIK